LNASFNVGDRDRRLPLSKERIRAEDISVGWNFVQLGRAIFLISVSNSYELATLIAISPDLEMRYRYLARAGRKPTLEPLVIQAGSLPPFFFIILELLGQ
jgi:hypothetical protein